MVRSSTLPAPTATRRADLALARRLAAAGDTDAARALFARHGISYVPAAEVCS